MAEKLRQAPNYETCFWIFRNILPIHGDFLSMQHACDCNYSTLINFDENDFIRCGPGALGGINKCFGLHLDPAREFDMQVAAQTVRDLVTEQEKWFTRSGLEPVTLQGRSLSLVDLQNCLCELDKITRVTHPQYNGARTKIKHSYDPAKAQPLPPLVLPAKWGISQPNHNAGDFRP
jgi:alpha-glutamyl/putrescinyl thymine pyrophosphorylase clade 1